MIINPNIDCDEVVVRDPHGGGQRCHRLAVPTGWEIIAVGPSRSYLLAQLAACGQQAAHLLGSLK